MDLSVEYSKLKKYMSVTCVVYLFGGVQWTHVVMGSTQKVTFKSTTIIPLEENSIESEELSLNETKSQEMVIFDLDYVIWPFFVDTDKRFNKTFPTLSAQGYNAVEPYPEVKEVLEFLTENEYKIGLIGQVEKTKRAIDLLKRFDIYKYFQFIELGMETKLTLIQRIENRANVSFNNILFIEHDYNQVASDEVLDIIYKHVFLMYIDDLGLRKKYIKNALFVFNQRPKKNLWLEKKLREARENELQNVNATKRSHTRRPRFNSTTLHSKKIR